jgi:hypothetical protein
LFGYYGWYADEVNGTFGTHLNGFTMTDDIIESKRDTGNTRHTRYRRKTNKTKIQQREILVTLDTQDTRGRKTKQ